MKLLVDHKALSAAIKRVMPAVGRVNVRPILSAIRLDFEGQTLRLQATDLDLTITATITANGTGDGTLIVPANHLARVVDGMQGDVRIEAIADGIALSSGGTHCTLRVHDPREWPMFDDVVGEAVSLDAEQVGLLRRCQHAMHTDQTKPATCGLRLDGNKAMATDMAQAVVATLDGANMPPVTVPTRAVTTVLATKPQRLDIVVSQHDVSLSDGTTEWRTRINDAAFPNMQHLLDSLSSTHKVVIDATTLRDALDRIAGFPFHFYAVAEATFESDLIRLTADVPDVGSIVDEMPATGGEGLPPTLLNIRQLLDAMAASGLEDEVTIGMQSDARPQEIQGDGIHLLVMPVLRNQVKW